MQRDRQIEEEKEEGARQWKNSSGRHRRSSLTAAAAALPSVHCVHCYLISSSLSLSLSTTADDDAAVLIGDRQR